jgi:hypothetical protein
LTEKVHGSPVAQPFGRKYLPKKSQADEKADSGNHQVDNLWLMLAVVAVSSVVSLARAKPTSPQTTVDGVQWGTGKQAFSKRLGETKMTEYEKLSLALLSKIAEGIRLQLDRPSAAPGVDPLSVQQWKTSFKQWSTSLGHIEKTIVETAKK